MNSVGIGLNSFVWGCAWQSTLCLVLGAAVSFCLRSRAVRAHEILVLSIVAAVTTPFLGLAVQKLNWGLLSPAVAIEKAGPAFSANEAGIRVHLSSSSELSIRGQVDSTTFATNAAFLSDRLVNPVPRVRAEEGRIVPAGALIMWGWIVLSTAALIRLGISFVRGRAVLARSTRLENSAMARAVAAAAGKLRIDETADLRASTEVQCPLIWCWRDRPVLLVPQRVLSSRQIDWESLFCHELAHWKRRDHVSSLVAELACVAMPWQLLFWWARKRLAHLADAVCDEWALQCGQSGVSYADALLEMFPQTRSIAAIPAVRNLDALKRRLVRILSSLSPQPLAGVWWTRCCSAAAGIIIVTLALLQVPPRSAAASKAPEQQLASRAVNPSGTDITNFRAAAAARQLNTAGFAFPFEATLSPDGKFLAGSTWQGELILVDTETSRRKSAAKCLISTPVVWSPDSKRVAYLVERKEPKRSETDLCVLSLESGEIEVVLHNPPWLKDWSPDGTMILGATNKTGVPNQAVILVDMKSKKRTVLESQTMTWTSPQFSPDSKYVAYPMVEEGRSVLCIQRVDGSNRVKFANFPGNMSDSMWSPDGRFVAFTPGNREIWVASLADGTCRKLVAIPEDVATSAWSPRWSPDGKVISVGVNDGNKQYWMIENFLPRQALAAK